MLVAVAVLVSSGSNAGAVTVNDCLASKLTGLRKAVSLSGKCASRFATSNEPVRLAECLAAAETKMTLFEKAESRYAMASPSPCLTYDDTAAAVELAEELGAELALDKTNHSSPGNPSRCDGARVKCISKYLARQLRCFADAASSTGELDPGCEEVEEERLGQCLHEASSRGDCTPPNLGATVIVPVLRYGLRRSLCLLDESEAPGGCPACQDDTADACWFLGADGQSCTSVCSDNNRIYDEITKTLTGSDGILAGCTVIAERLDIQFSLSGQGSCPPNGLGCHWYPANDVVGQCTSPPTTPDAAFAGARRICACQ